MKVVKVAQVLYDFAVINICYQRRLTNIQGTDHVTSQKEKRKRTMDPC